MVLTGLPDGAAHSTAEFKRLVRPMSPEIG